MFLCLVSDLVNSVNYAVGTVWLVCAGARRTADITSYGWAWHATQCICGILAGGVAVLTCRFLLPRGIGAVPLFTGRTEAGVIVRCGVAPESGAGMCLRDVIDSGVEGSPGLPHHQTSRRLLILMVIYE